MGYTVHPFPAFHSGSLIRHPHVLGGWTEKQVVLFFHGQTSFIEDLPLKNGDFIVSFHGISM